ncbi:hypothetical protein JTE90_017801 [Oedothorax gibbosus]|uniref:Uncharacterized protein n=1 Tax=Oedothorax gibbosus TaxID=931172 RepID=A0AAV6U5U4_9ARAC|nr:hypothetical protein JTE90_017801 [Oedothorax gibbosus]
MNAHKSQGCSPLTYKMSSKPVGLCLIINNINFSKSRTRDESKFDVSALRSLFEFLGFKVTVEQDLTAQEMTNCLEKLSKTPELGRVDSIIVYILTHGDRDKYNVDKLRGIDEEEVALTNVYEMFNHNNCEMLLGKPKLFFFQACRGKEEDLGCFKRLADTDATSFQTSDRSSFTLVHFPSLADTIVVHSTMPCHLSIIDKHQGSWLCQELIHVFTTDHSRHDLFTMLNTVSKRMENRTSGDKCKQTVHIEQFGVSGIVKFGLDKCKCQDIFEQVSIQDIFESSLFSKGLQSSLFSKVQSSLFFQSIAEQYFSQRIAEQYIFQKIAMQDFLQWSEQSFFQSIAEQYLSQRIADQSSFQRIAKQHFSQRIAEQSFFQRIAG